LTGRNWADIRFCNGQTVRGRRHCEDGILAAGPQAADQL